MEAKSTLICLSDAILTSFSPCSPEIENIPPERKCSVTPAESTVIGIPDKMISEFEWYSLKVSSRSPFTGVPSTYVKHFEV